MLKKFLRVMIWVLLVVVIYVLLDAIPAARTPAFSADVLPNAATYCGTDAENELIFRLTGLGASAVHDFKQAGVLESALEIFYRQKQEALHTKDEYLCFPTTKAEVLHDEEGSRRELVFPPVHAGDILITKSTETLLYRHGHAALVLDDSGRTIE